MASARDAGAGSSARSSRAGENRQDPRGSSDSARGGGGAGEGRAACWHGKKTIFPGCHTLSRHLPPPSFAPGPCRTGAAPRPGQRGWLLPHDSLPAAPGRLRLPGARARPGPDAASPPPVGAQGGRTWWPVAMQYPRGEKGEASPGADLPACPRHLLGGAGGKQGPAPAPGSTSRKLRS